MAAGSRSSGLGGAVMKRKTTLSMVMLAGCAYPAGLYRLETLPSSDVGTEHLGVRAKVELDHQPVQGWDMVLDLHLHAHAGKRPLVDLSRTMLRSDETRWISCQLPPEEDPDHLRLRLHEEEAIHLVLRCLQVQRPERQIEVRVPLSGAGGKGYLELAFSGVGNAGDASSWELD